MKIIICPSTFHHQNVGIESFCRQIEENGIYIENTLKIINVYYLAEISPDSQRLCVGYFIEWTDEHPDYGRIYKPTVFCFLSQIMAPLFWTRVLYLPFSKGLQRPLYGPADVEGIFAEYSIRQGNIDSLVYLTFELPGHQGISISSDSLNNHFSIQSVVKNNVPFLRVASWNHLFGQPAGTPPELYHPKKFDYLNWNRLCMNHKRANIVKEAFLSRGLLFNQK